MRAHVSRRRPLSLVLLLSSRRSAVGMLSRRVARARARRLFRWHWRRSAGRRGVSVVVAPRHRSARGATWRAGGRAARRRLGWFLEKIASESNAPVHLITCARGKSDAGRVAADLGRLGQRLPSGGVQTLSVTLAASRHFVQQSHPRHVRFGRVAIGLDRGLSMFDGSHCPHSMPCNLIDQATAREREERIEREAFSGFRRQVIW